MSHVLAPAPQTVSPSTQEFARLAGAALLGLIAMSVLAQITISLPWTPVPITGQTFGVATLALVGGRKLAFATVAAYLTLGVGGLPILANGGAHLPGATAGYLLGMLVASVVVGTLADRGWTKTWWSALAAAYCGSVCTFAAGVFVLSYFVPAPALLTAGVTPFLLGDLIKNVAAASVAVGTRRVRGI